MKGLQRSQLRKRGWTQEYLAEKLGIQKTQVTRWETARSRPSMKTLKKLAPLLGVATDELLDEQASGLPEGGPSQIPKPEVIGATFVASAGRPSSSFPRH
ncbi:MAG: helix-turn-helix transcriptional regulator [Proteobacteria bacterium]|nr:helix-turn-helix transcriptional regulator [Pseudomonadota bacterium]